MSELLDGWMNEWMNESINQSMNEWMNELINRVYENVKSTDPFVLKAREAFLIKKFDSFRNGLNKDPGSWNFSLASVGILIFSILSFWLSWCFVTIINFRYQYCEHDLFRSKLISHNCYFVNTWSKSFVVINIIMEVPMKS